MRPGHGARKTRKRVGRGEGSGHGRQSGRGGKGQTARTGGGVRPGFEGGQMPLYRRVPKFGFVSRRRVLGLNRCSQVNLSALERFENGATVDPESLRRAGWGRRASFKAGIKILGGGQLTKKLHVKAHAFSAAARKKIESLGGSVEVLAKKDK